MLRNKVILITGATGFVGYHLAKNLAEENIVYCIVRPNSKIDKLQKYSNIKFIYYNGELSDLADQLLNIDVDLVYHLASLFISEHKTQDVDNLIDSNIKFPTQLLEVLTNRNKPVKLINAGTSWQNFENSNYNPVCLYAATKQSFEDILRFYHEINGVSNITLRLFDTYGPDDTRKKLFWLLDNLRATGNALDMSYGEQKLNLVYITDVIDAFKYSGEVLLKSTHPVNSIYNVCSDHSIRLKEIVNIYQKVNGCELKINWGKKNYRTREVMEPSVLHYPIVDGWRCKVDIETGISLLQCH